MINYALEEVKYEGCPSCCFARGEFSLPCGMAYENERFTLSQDWELPIEGFFVVTPKRCVECFSELSSDEQHEMFDIVNKTIKILRENNICERFNVLFEEKENRHLHVWIMPRHEWMEQFGSITKHIDDIFNYAKDNFRNEDVYKRINEISSIVRNNF